VKTNPPGLALFFGEGRALTPGREDMKVEGIKQAVHRMTNYLQEVLGYLELEQYAKALTALKRTIGEMQLLAKTLTGFVVPDRVPSDMVVVAPEDATVLRVDPAQQKTIVVVPKAAGVVSPSDLKRGAAPDVLHLVHKDEIKKGTQIRITEAQDTEHED
jgi:hypothetical protein